MNFFIRLVEIVRVEPQARHYIQINSDSTRPPAEEI